MFSMDLFTLSWVHRGIFWFLLGMITSRNIVAQTTSDQGYFSPSFDFGFDLSFFGFPLPLARKQSTSDQGM
jgi:hypothetical protein